MFKRAQPNIALFKGTIERDDLEIGTNFKDLKFIPFIGLESALEENGDILQIAEYRELGKKFDFECYAFGNQTAKIEFIDSKELKEKYNMTYPGSDFIYVPDLDQLSKVVIGKPGDQLAVHINLE